MYNIAHVFCVQISLMLRVFVDSWDGFCNFGANANVEAAAPHFTSNSLCMYVCGADGVRCMY